MGTFRPKIDKEKIEKYKPPTTPTSKESEEALPSFTVFTNERSDDVQSTEDKMIKKSQTMKKEKEKRKEAIVSNAHHRKTSSFKITPKKKKNKEVATTNPKPKIIIKPKIKQKTKALPSNPTKPLPQQQNLQKTISPI